MECRDLEIQFQRRRNDEAGAGSGFWWRLSPGIQQGSSLSHCLPCLHTPHLTLDRMLRAGQGNQLWHKAKASVMMHLHHYPLFCTI
ncbi:hypothetical protein CDEST_02025 [Colletotrichum destructivum]|uniref:Uncharacterized protein n=1 Tax=Colletotrichum destructivum TaxID=34406 RepID=A0AAX4I1D2_9PEZI|nr:hypothetical protein CDEST_02025 [Colletotrichum destructivum]